MLMFRYSGDAGDGLQIAGQRYQNGMKFSTTDNDNDQSPNNCARACGGGSWYNSCYWICLTCFETTDFGWWSLPDTSNYFLQSARMMIKPQ